MGEDTEDMASATAVDTPPLDTLDSEATLVASTASVRLRPSPRLRLRPIPTPDSATLVATLDSDTEVTDTPVASTASVRLRPSLRLRLRLRLIPTTDTDTLA